MAPRTSTCPAPHCFGLVTYLEELVYFYSFSGGGNGPAGGEAALRSAPSNKTQPGELGSWGPGQRISCLDSAAATQLGGLWNRTPGGAKIIWCIGWRSTRGGNLARTVMTKVIVVVARNSDGNKGPAGDANGWSWSWNSSACVRITLTLTPPPPPLPFLSHQGVHNAVARFARLLRPQLASNSSYTCEGPMLTSARVRAETEGELLSPGLLLAVLIDPFVSGVAADHLGRRAAAPEQAATGVRGRNRGRTRTRVSEPLGPSLATSALEQRVSKGQSPGRAGRGREGASGETVLTAAPQAEPEVCGRRFPPSSRLLAPCGGRWWHTGRCEPDS
ncbi:hypothetical protein GQ53DRAFT_91768 [Thozetella sp. PMI_491]|nr:hypothetical protein GQ53DRAFT_91768 [Thozetella sp. PMI_491]